jgi:hypothetical protein
MVTKEGLIGHPVIDVCQLSTDGLCFLLRCPKHGLDGLKAFPESLRLQDWVHVRCGPDQKKGEKEA